MVTYDVGGTLNCVIYFRLSVPKISPFEKCLRSITLSKNRFNFDEFVLPVANPLVSWQFKQMTSAPHCSAKHTQKMITKMIKCFFYRNQLYVTFYMIYMVYKIGGLPIFPLRFSSLIRSLSSTISAFVPITKIGI